MASSHRGRRQFRSAGREWGHSPVQILTNKEGVRPACRRSDPPPRRLTLTWGPSSHASESLGSVCCFNPEFLSCKTRSCQERSRKSVKRAVRQDPALPGRGQSCLMVVGVVSSRTLCPGNRPGAQGCGARAERGARPPEGTGLRRDAPPPTCRPVTRLPRSPLHGLCSVGDDLELLPIGLFGFAFGRGSEGGGSWG